MAHADQVELHGGGTSWSALEAWDELTWAHRIDALLPDGVSLTIRFTVDCTGGDVCEKLVMTESESLSKEQHFDRVASVLGISKAAKARARALQPTLYTVQVFSGTEKGALAMRDSLVNKEEGDTLLGASCFEQGGFPAFNPGFHAVRDIRDASVVRVVAGVHCSLEAAQETAKGLRAAGVKAFATPLPRAEAIAEPDYSLAG